MKFRKDFGDRADGRIQPPCDSTVYNSLYCDEQELWSWGKKGYEDDSQKAVRTPHTSVCIDLLFLPDNDAYHGY